MLKCLQMDNTVMRIPFIRKCSYKILPMDLLYYKLYIKEIRCWKLYSNLLFIIIIVEVGLLVYYWNLILLQYQALNDPDTVWSNIWLFFSGLSYVPWLFVWSAKEKCVWSLCENYCWLLLLQDHVLGFWRWRLPVGRLKRFRGKT